MGKGEKIKTSFLLELFIPCRSKLIDLYEDFSIASDISIRIDSSNWSNYKRMEMRIECTALRSGIVISQGVKAFLPDDI